MNVFTTIAGNSMLIAKSSACIFFDTQSACEHIWEKDLVEGKDVQGKQFFVENYFFQTVLYQTPCLSIRQSKTLSKHFWISHYNHPVFFTLRVILSFL